MVPSKFLAKLTHCFEQQYTIKFSQYLYHILVVHSPSKEKVDSWTVSVAARQACPAAVQHGRALRREGCR